MPPAIEVSRFRAWAQGCVQALADARTEIDALNVFPVPDSDTGTNVYLTLQAGCTALEEQADDAAPVDAVQSFAGGVLTGAQGNSGVIVAQLIRGVLHALRSVDTLTPADVVDALQSATRDAYRAVADPQEGTILTVAAAATEGARERSRSDASVGEVVEAAADAARSALIETPSQLAVLAEAGVVDAGGRALVVLLDATVETMTGRRPPAQVSGPPPRPLAAAKSEADPYGPGYEVMYLLDALDDSIDPLREALAGLGDSLVVVGGDGLWNVHVHVDDVGAAIEAGIEAGRPHRIRVTALADSAASRVPGSHPDRDAAQEPGSRPRRVVVTAVTGAGLAELARDSGAVAVEFSAGHPLDETMMAEALHSVEAEEVIVLPNRIGHLSPFEAVAKQLRDGGARVAVLPTQAQVQGIAALAVHDPARDFDDDVVAMSAAAAHARHGAVTVAGEAGITMGGPCEVGDVLGAVNNDFLVIGSDQKQVALEILRRLDSAGAEMVTLVAGAGCPAELPGEVERHLGATQPHVDVVVYDGQQEKYTLFIAVE